MDDDNVKVDVLHEEKHIGVNGANPEFDHITERKLVRKIDLRLLPILGALYSIALIDRTNVSVTVPFPLDLHEVD